MFNIGKSDSSACRLCLEEDESARHILCECAAVARIRLHLFGNGFPNPSDIRKAEPKKVIEFFRKLEDDLQGE